MRKSGDQDISSLDMLLDTMCNTFGGIVFIALLIAILSTSLSRQEVDASQENQETIVEVDNNIETTRLFREQQELQAAISHLKTTLIRNTSDRGASGEELATLVASNETIRNKLIYFELTNSVLAKAIAETEEATKRNTTTEADLRKQVANLSDDLREKRQEAVRTIRLPMLHQVAGKRRVFAAVKDGKFYSVSFLSNEISSWDSKFDPEDVSVESGPLMDVIEPRKQGGQRVVANCEQHGKIAMALATLNPATAVLAFAVYTNSFAEFNYVKAVFVQKGFEYEWIVCEGALTIIKSSDPIQAQ